MTTNRLSIREEIIAELVKLGDNQIRVLCALNKYGGWPGGWYYGSRSRTIRILQSLVRRGYVIKIERGERLLPYYKIAPGIYEPK